jgi:decaprenylphospho-beta-D-erythro-pentofuranosid-2-ulose 2-reductase
MVLCDPTSHGDWDSPEVKDALGSVQTVLVLGGSSEIGAATARLLVGRGTERVLLAGRDDQAMDEVAGSLRGMGAQVETLAFDATSIEDHEKFVDEVFSAPTDIDVVIVAFGVLGDQDAIASDRTATLDMFATNLIGALSVIMPVVEQLKKQGHGILVVLSSVAAERPRRSNFVYGASKAGLDWFVQGLQYRLTGTGVRAVLVRPGFVRTKMTAGLAPKPLTVGPDEVAQAISSAIASDAEIVWVPGTLRWVMTVLRHLPRSILRRFDF